MTKNLATLADYFRQNDFKIEQYVGNSLYLRKCKDNLVLTGLQKRKLAKVKSECGMCVAAHAADHFGTKPYKRDADVINSKLHYMIRNAFRFDGTKSPKQLMVRLHDDGITAIFKRLRKGRDFKEWYKKTYSVEFYGPATYRDVEKYLEEKCGAPHECFSVLDWPDSIKPADVFDRAHELNFG